MTSEMRPHKYPFEMCFNSIRNTTTGCLLNDPAMIIMLDTGSPLKIGENDDMRAAFETIKETGIDIELIRFNLAYPELGFTPNGYNFTPSEICTLLNWLSSFSIGGDRWEQFKNLSLDDMKEQLQAVQKMMY